MFDVTDKEKQVFTGFVNQLVKWSKGGETPTNGNQDTAYYLNLQKERLQKKGLRLQYDLRERENFEVHGTTKRSNKYTCTMAWQSFFKKTSIFQGNKRIYQHKDNELVYGIVTSMNQSEMTGEETYVCPNCGGVSTINQLFKGCPYCETRFTMEDLYPKVTNHFFLRDYGQNEKEMKAMTIKYVLIGMVICCIIMLFLGLMDTMKGREFNLSSRIFKGCLIGGFYGLLAVPLSLFFGILKDAIKTLPILSRTTGTKKKITEILSAYDNTFSYDHFVSRVLALLKMIVYSHDRTDMPAYDKPEKGPDYSDIVESVYRGAMALKNHTVENGYCYLELEVIMVDLCLKKGRIKRVEESFFMVICKNIEKPENFGFSIKKVQCKGCGASFDATRIKHCPHCRSEYELKEDDWVVLSIWRQ